MSDSSLYDEVCDDCGARDYTLGLDELSARPCLARRVMENGDIYPPEEIDHWCDLYMLGALEFFPFHHLDWKGDPIDDRVPYPHEDLV